MAEKLGLTRNNFSRIKIEDFIWTVTFHADLPSHYLQPALYPASPFE